MIFDNIPKAGGLEIKSFTFTNKVSEQHSFGKKIVPLYVEYNMASVGQSPWDYEYINISARAGQGQWEKILGFGTSWGNEITEFYQTQYNPKTNKLEVFKFHVENQRNQSDLMKNVTKKVIDLPDSVSVWQGDSGFSERATVTLYYYEVD